MPLADGSWLSVASLDVPSTELPPIPIIYVTVAGAVRLMEDLRPYTPPSMHYKLQLTGRNDMETCMFCGTPFRLSQLRRRTDLPWFPCCGANDCWKQRRHHNREWLKSHPEASKQHKRRCHDKRRAAQAAAMPPCSICGQPQTLQGHGRADRKVCPACRPEYMRRKAKARWLAKKQACDSSQTNSSAQAIDPLTSTT